ncbi:serine protease nudel-like [Trichogramma pretiosum]|uniref:serine protease nudel-like n=1 Tax=Trichogramma pretiosum TaxID=7493 RepID=UPI0006C9CCEE|nr:serine protease nudel-like [Trichogramma pretiosum]
MKILKVFFGFWLYWMCFLCCFKLVNSIYVQPNDSITTSNLQNERQESNRWANTSILLRPINPSALSSSAHIKPSTVNGDEKTSLSAVQKRSQQLPINPWLLPQAVFALNCNPRGSDGNRRLATRDASPISQSSWAQTPPGYYCTYVPVPPTYQVPMMPWFADYYQAAFGQSMSRDVEGLNNKLDQLNPYEAMSKAPTSECPLNFYKCRGSAQCVPRNVWCDGVVDCADASDEIKCTCRDRIDRKRLCDNYFDCPHGEDEMGCYGCSRHSFSCLDFNSDSLSCFSAEQRCDGIKHCVSGRDEEFCTILTPFASDDAEVFPIGYNLGFLRRNVQGKWYPVCGPVTNWAKDACTYELGQSDQQPIVDLVNLPTYSDSTVFATELGSETKLVTGCSSQVTYVRCQHEPTGHRHVASGSAAALQSINDFSEIILGLTAQSAGKSDDPVLGIVGGHDSYPRAWPFIVAMSKNGRFHCGGAILSAYWILTAAHCLYRYEGNYYEIEAGMLRLSSFAPSRQTRRLDGIILHEAYDPIFLRNDIALGLLNEPLLFNSWVRPVNLPNPETYFYRQEPSHGDLCVAVGWGTLSEGGREPDHLKEVEIPIVNCKRPEDINSGEICAGYRAGGRDACQGDSGGPLMCRRGSGPDDEWYVGGIVSHGIGCAKPNEPGAYTKVSHYIPWINFHIRTRQSPVMVYPRTSCPGFSCNRPQAKCLAPQMQCDRIADCLEAEDEENCPFDDYVLGASRDTVLKNRLQSDVAARSSTISPISL